MKKIRIMHVAQAAGGVDRYIQILLKYLNGDKFENILVCSQDFKKEDYNGLVEGFEQLMMTRTIGMHDIKVALEVRKLIKKYHPDIVYAHSSKAGAIVRLANIGMLSKCVYNPHGWAFNMKCSKVKQRFYIAIEKLAALFCDRIVCISETEKQSALEHRICKENKLHVILSGVDVEAFDESVVGAVGSTDNRHGSDALIFTHKTLGIPDGTFVIGMVGRLCLQKAPDVFLQAAKIIKKKVDNTFFVIVGNGPMEEEARKYAAKNGLADSLLITGWVTNPLDYVQLFDVSVLLSRWEGFGLAIPEAMMVGKPVVATKVDAIPELIKERENGLLVEADNPEKAAEAVLELLRDVELKEKIVQNGLKDVHERFNARRSAEEHEKLFDGMTAN